LSLSIKEALTNYSEYLKRLQTSDRFIFLIFFPMTISVALPELSEWNFLAKNAFKTRICLLFNEFAIKTSQSERHLKRKDISFLPSFLLPCLVVFLSSLPFFFPSLGRKLAPFGGSFCTSPKRPLFVPWRSRGSFGLGSVVEKKRKKKKENK